MSKKSNPAVATVVIGEDKIELKFSSKMGFYYVVNGSTRYFVGNKYWNTPEQEKAAREHLNALIMSDPKWAAIVAVNEAVAKATATTKQEEDEAMNCNHEEVKDNTCVKCGYDVCGIHHEEIHAGVCNQCMMITAMDTYNNQEEEVDEDELPTCDVCNGAGEDRYEEICRSCHGTGVMSVPEADESDVDEEAEEELAWVNEHRLDHQLSLHTMPVQRSLKASDGGFIIIDDCHHDDCDLFFVEAVAEMQYTPCCDFAGCEHADSLFCTHTGEVSTNNKEDEGMSAEMKTKVPHSTLTFEEWMSEGGKMKRIRQITEEEVEWVKPYVNMTQLTNYHNRLWKGALSARYTTINGVGEVHNNEEYMGFIGHNGETFVMVFDSHASDVENIVVPMAQFKVTLDISLGNGKFKRFLKTRDEANTFAASVSGTVYTATGGFWVYFMKEVK